MYFLVLMKQHINAPPEVLGPSLKEYLIQELYKKLGSCSNKYGFLLSIFSVESIEQGIVNQYGDAIFTVKFKALVFRPIKNEILDSYITDVKQMGATVKVGLFEVLIPHKNMPKDFVYD